MQSVTSHKIARDISTSSILTEEAVSSDEYMRRLGFVEMTPAESKRYDRFFRCAGRRSNYFANALRRLLHRGILAGR
jgi:hypothetical protein